MNEGETGKLKILNENTIEIKEETHTLMNPLKWIISSNWCDHKVEFCGYNVPHPSNPIINLSIQFENESDNTKENMLHTMEMSADLLKKCCIKILNQL